MSRETLVYRPGHPQADKFGFVSKEIAGPRHASSSAFMVIRDIEPYRAMAADKNTGERPVIGGRRQHREFLRSNGYAEVGNDYVAPRRESLSRSDRVSDIRRAFGE